MRCAARMSLTLPARLRELERQLDANRGPLVLQGVTSLQEVARVAATSEADMSVDADDLGGDTAIGVDS